MNAELKQNKPKRKSDQVLEQIRELIFRGRLKPGEQLMPEQELADALTVSHTTVRNAVRKLVTMGLLEERQGQGTFVRSFEAWRKGNPLAAALENQQTSLMDLLEVRLALECNAAVLAAQRAEKKDIDHMSKSIEEMDKAILSNQLGVTADTSFHMAIAFATKNPFQVYIMKNFFDLLFSGTQERIGHLYEDQTSHTAILRHHRNILKAVSRGDSKGAYASMKRHIHFEMDFFSPRTSPRKKA